MVVLPCQCEAFSGADIFEQLHVCVAPKDSISIGTFVPGNTSVRSSGAADADNQTSAFTVTAESGHINPTAAPIPACTEPLIVESTQQPAGLGGGCAAAIPAPRSPTNGLAPTSRQDIQGIVPAPLAQEEASGSNPVQQGLPLCTRLRLAREAPPQVPPEPISEPVLWVGKQLSGKHRRNRQRENR